MSAAYLIGLGRDAEAEGDGDSAGTSAGVSSSDGRSILLFARGLGAQPADLVRLYEASATAAGRPAGHTAGQGTGWAAQAAQGLGPWRRDAWVAFSRMDVGAAREARIPCASCSQDRACAWPLGP